MENKYIAYWHTDDKEWLKARKKEWLDYKKGVDDIPFIRRKDHKYLREFFLTGLISDDYCLPTTKGQSYPNLHAIGLYYLFFSPINDIRTLKEILLAEGNAGNKPKQGWFFEAIHAFTQYAHSALFESDFGMLGGREELLVDVIFGQTFDEHVSFLQELYGRTPPQAHPLSTIGYFQGACSTWFAHLPDGKTYGLPRYSPIQWLVDHWVQSLHALDADDLKKAADDMSIKILMVNLAKEIVDPPFADDRYQKTRDKILQYLESDELPAAYKEIWVKAKEGCLDPYA
ncbi:MAG: hypothetical protein MI864_19385 [Pseudomonadales bacterium]|nr:hypothetical protein [Pseudomonadales bacterium]